MKALGIGTLARKPQAAPPASLAYRMPLTGVQGNSYFPGIRFSRAAAPAIETSVRFSPTHVSLPCLPSFSTKPRPPRLLPRA
jgi:hypothetical protein